MKIRRSKYFILLVVAILVVMQTTAFAQTFTDVPDWAKSYIEKMNEAGIITGYGDGTFRPNGQVTREQAMVMIGRMLKMDSQKKAEAVKEHEAFMNEVGVSTWAKEGVAVCLSSGIVSKDVIKTKFYVAKVPQTVQKDELCIYLTRAMGLEGEAKSKVIINLPFIDSELMALKVQAYVEVMIEKGVINKDGDAQGKFNPKSTVNRAVMAKMLCVAYDYMQNNDVSTVIDDGEGDNEDSNNDVKTVDIDGSITDLLLAGKEAYITVDGPESDDVVYIAGTDSKIYIDGKLKDFDDLSEGLNVIVKVTQDKKIIELNGTTISKEYKGTIKERILANPVKIQIEYKVGTKKYNETFKVDDDVEVTLDGKDAFIYQVDKGDIATIDVRNNMIVAIDAESKNKDVTGVIKDLSFKPEPVLTIENSNGITLEYEIDNSASIKRNKKSAEITDLKIGDKVELEVEYNVIDRIEASVIKTDDEGTIEAILIAKNNKLTITNKEKEEVSYFLSNNVEIEIDNKKSTIYDLRLGYFVELEVESDEIVEIDAKATSIGSQYEGTITYINEDANVMIISVYNYDKKETEDVRVDVTDKTSFIDISGDSTRFRYLDEHDKVIVIGESDGGIFKAKTVIVTSEH